MQHDDSTPGQPAVTGTSASSQTSGIPAPRRGLSRRAMLRAAGGGLAAVAGAGLLYEALAHLAAPARPSVRIPQGYPEGQHEIAAYGVRVTADTGVEVLVPPVWNLAITATLTRAPTPDDQRRLEAALQAVEAAYPYTPAGIFALVGYGLPYFRRYIRPDAFAAHLPHMTADGAPALLDAVRFATDNPFTVLEAYDVVFHLRSDVLAHLTDVRRALFERSGTLAGRRAPATDLSDLFTITSLRTGFVGAGLPRRMAEQAGLAVAGRIPEEAPLFMGFTSTQRLGQAAETAVRFDAPHEAGQPPLTTAAPGDYFAGGTTLHLSHLTEDLDGWYMLPYAARVARMFHPGTAAPDGRVTLPTGLLAPNPTSRDAAQGVLGHTATTQSGSRSPGGAALLLRADFNTLDALDGSTSGPGVHFLAFAAGSPIFHASRQAMDATAIADQHGIARRANGINGFIGATRRQNFLAPPRRHRAFPLLGE